MTMTSSIARAVLAVLLMAGGLVCWKAAQTADRLAARHQRVATLQPPDEQTLDASWLAPVVAALGGDPAHHREADEYWQGRYEADSDRAATGNNTEPAVLQILANAAFRRSQRDAGLGTMSVERLDQALDGYASVLRNSGFVPDAAYNYEYVARLRDAAARAKPPARRSPPAPPRAAPSSPLPGPLPAGPTIHGHPGMHPPPTRGEEFEVLTPMDFGDREAQPEATPGRKLPRKG